MKSINRAKILTGAAAAGLSFMLCVGAGAAGPAGAAAAKKDAEPVKKATAAVEIEKKVAPAAIPAKKSARDNVKEILTKTVKAYNAAPVYETGFYLQQPRTAAEVDDGELMMKLREKYRLLYRRGRGGAESDSLRLEGVQGTNQGTTAVWTGGAKAIIVYRPRYGAQKVAKGDKRIADFFTLDVKFLAEDLLNAAGGAKTNVSLAEEQCPKDGMSGAKAECYAVTLAGGTFGAKAYISKDTSLMEMIEYQLADKKGGLYLTKRLTWFKFEPRDVTEKEITAKPVH